MNNVRDNGVKITLDQERTMKFSLNALCDLQDEYDDVMDVFGKAMNDRDFKVIRKLVYVSLRDEDESLTERQVGSMITMQNLTDVINVLGDVLAASVPEGKPEAVETATES